jgi:quercetin dioxygenase-like cupin family protein
MKVDLPDIITKLPEIDIRNDSIKGYLIQGEMSQSVFFLAKAGTKIPDHTHADEWGIVIDGEFEISVGSDKKVYRKGDTFFVPADALHSGYFITNAFSFHVVDDKGYFKLKPSISD